MDATLCDTVGSQIVSNKRNRAGNTVASMAAPVAKVALKPPVPQPAAVVRPNGDFAATGVVEPAGQGAGTSQVISSGAAVTSVSTVAINSTHAPDVKPLLVLSSDIVTTGVHTTTVVPSSSFISSPCLTETVSTSPALGSTSNADLNASRYTARKAPSFSPGVIPFRLSNTQNLLGVSSSFPTTCSCLSSSVPTSSSATTVAGGEGQNPKRHEQQTSPTMFQEILKRQEEQGYLDRVARRRVEAREKRRERREVRMAESLGRIATALELLSSKQDTVIALLQRLADRK